MDYAFTFIENNGGIDTEKDYAYNAMQGTCDVGKRDRHVVTIDGHEDVPPNDELSLMKVRAACLARATSLVLSLPTATAIVLLRDRGHVTWTL